MTGRKFKVGQTVRIENPIHVCGPRIFKIKEISRRFGLIFYGDGKNPQYSQSLLQLVRKKKK